MITFIELIFFLLVHWVADFCYQTDEQAKNKSKSNYYLLSHTVTYSAIWFIFIALYLMTIKSEEPVMFFKIGLFTVITFLSHTVQDYFTSRLNTKLWNKGDTHNFFVSVGFDQVLHYIQLIGTYLLLFK